MRLPRSPSRGLRRPSLQGCAAQAHDFGGLGRRFLLASPLRGADDLNAVLMALVVFLGLPSVTLRRQHIRVDVLVPVLPAGLRGALERVFGLAGAAILGIIAWRLAATAGGLAEFGDSSPMLKIPLAPVAYALSALSLAAAAMQAVVALGGRPAAA